MSTIPTLEGRKQCRTREYHVCNFHSSIFQTSVQFCFCLFVSVWLLLGPDNVDELHSFTLFFLLRLTACCFLFYIFFALLLSQLSQFLLMMFSSRVSLGMLTHPQTNDLILFLSLFYTFCVMASLPFPSIESVNESKLFYFMIAIYYVYIHRHCIYACDLKANNFSSMNESTTFT